MTTDNKPKLTFKTFTDALADKLDMSKKYPDYFNKWVFRISAYTILILFIVVLIMNGVSNRVGISCNQEVRCINPLYLCKHSGDNLKTFMMYDCPDKLMAYAELSNESERMYLEPHEYIGDKKPVWLYSNFFVSVIIILMLAFIINHILWRRKGGKNVL